MAFSVKLFEFNIQIWRVIFPIFNRHFRRIQ